jgi:hypothetical protein
MVSSQVFPAHLADEAAERTQVLTEQQHDA